MTVKKTESYYVIASDDSPKRYCSTPSGYECSVDLADALRFHQRTAELKRAKTAMAKAFPYSTWLYHIVHATTVVEVVKDQDIVDYGCGLAEHKELMESLTTDQKKLIVKYGVQ